MSFTISWFLAFVVLLFIEIITINLVTIWFAIGSLAAFIASFFTDSFVFQIVIFVIISIISLLITKPIVHKFKAFRTVPTNSDRVIGKVGEVIKKIQNNQYGEVKIFGNIWTATSDEEIDVGTRVRILDIEGVKLIVKKEEN